MRVAPAVCSLVIGVGIRPPGRHRRSAPGARTGEVWKFLGFPTYGSGPFERWGVPTSVALITGFVLVCAAERVLGVMIWVDAPGTNIFAIALLPFEVAYWVGFALRFGPPLGIARTVLLLLRRPLSHRPRLPLVARPGRVGEASS